MERGRETGKKEAYVQTVTKLHMLLCDHRGGAGISKVVRPLHIKDDSCMCKEGGRSTTGNVQMI